MTVVSDRSLLGDQAGSIAQNRRSGPPLDQGPTWRLYIRVDCLRVGEQLDKIEFKL